MTDLACEIDEKTDRLTRLAAATGTAGILVGLQPNFAWLSAGRSNRIDSSREPGNGMLLVCRDGRRFAIANTIEAPRLVSECLVAAGFDLIEYAWTDERADPSVPFRLAARAAGGRIGCDLAASEVEFLEPRISRLRSPFVPGELARYRQLGIDAGQAIGETVRAAEPGARELDVARDVAAAVHAIDARPVVLLVAGDDRIARFRHPVPTSQPWTSRLMVAVCAERGGLVVALSRVVSVNRVEPDFARRMQVAIRVFAALLDASRAGTTGSQLFDTAAAAYAAGGFPGEERRHHQGGAIGYRTREWIAHPASDEVLAPPQAVAWNPSVTGTKVEDTCLIDGDDGIELVTTSPAWPSISVTVRGTAVPVPDVLIHA